MVLIKNLISEIQFQVNELSRKLEPEEKIVVYVSKNLKVLLCEFFFKEEWENHMKTFNKICDVEMKVENNIHWGVVVNIAMNFGEDIDKKL